MTLRQMVTITGELPIKSEMQDGTKLELFIRRKNDNTYIACIWEMVNGVQERAFDFGEGATPTLAKEALKIKILNS